MITLLVVIVLVTLVPIGFAIFLELVNSAIWIVFGIGILVYILGSILEYKRIQSFSVR